MRKSNRNVCRLHGVVLASALFAIAAAEAAVPDYVTQAPLGQWTKIASNSAQSVAFPWGTGGYPNEGGQFNDLFGVWSGAAFDPRIPALYFSGGGHGSYDGNEFYAFRLDSNRWERVNDPSPHLETSASGGIFPDGLPQPVHTYGEVECDWDTGIIYRLSNGGSAINNTWSFNPNLAPHPMPYSETRSAWRQFTSAPVGSGYAAGFAWDPVTKKFYGGHNTSGFFSARFMDPRAGTSGNLPNPFGTAGFAPDLYPSVAIDPERRLMYVVGGRGSAGGSYVNKGTITYNISTQAWTNLTPTTSGDKLPETTEGGGLTYDSRRKLMWWWDGTPDTRALFRFDFASKTWSRVTPSGSGTPAAAYSQGTFNKLRYVEQYDVLVAVGGSTSSGTVEVWMYKPTDWAPGAPPPVTKTPNSPTNLVAN